MAEPPIFAPVKILVSIFMCFGLLFCAHAQESAEVRAFGKPSILASAHAGYLIPHGPQLQGLVTKHTQEFNVNVEWLTSGKRDWHHAYGRPFIGLDIWGADPGNRDLLGLQFSLAPYIRIPFNKNPFFTNSLKIVAGVGYISKIWDIDNNTKAIFVGSHFNAALALEYHVDFQVSEHLQLGTGLRFSHFSNGAFRTPNKGTNLASIFLAARFVPDNNDRLKALETGSREIGIPEKRWRTAIFGGFGLKEIGTPNQGKFASYSANITSTYAIGNKVNLGASLDYFYTSSLIPILEDLGRLGVSRKYANRLGLAGVFNLNFDTWYIEISTGAYVMDYAKVNGSVYSRFAIYYIIADHWLVGARLKTHFAKADNFELGLGWQF